MNKRARLGILLAIVLVAALAAGLVAFIASPAPDVPELALELASIDLPEPNGTAPALVTITRTDDPDLFLAADYADIYALDPTNGRLDRLTILGASRPNVPTGLAYDRSSKRLFIANYTSNNILVTKVDPARKTVTVEHEFGQDVAISPENISIDDRTGAVAVANYDGNDVQLWFRRTGSWAKSCSVSVPRAHGVAFSGEHVYATSLERREILKINPSQCTVVNRSGGVGWSKGEFLWPTHVAEWDGKHIAVSDAHTGRISIIRKADLSLAGVFGGNGPSLLNMPYAFARTADGALVLSTFGREVVKASVPKAEGSWGAHADPSMHRAPDPRKWVGYRRLDKSATFLRRCVNEGYASLVACDGRLSFVMPGTREEYFSGGSHFYFMEVAERATGWILSSPQNPNLLFIRRDDLRTAILTLGTDVWQIGSDLVGQRGSIGMDAIDAASARFLDEADAVLGSGPRSIEQMTHFLSRRSTQALTGSDAGALVPQFTGGDPARSARFAELMRLSLSDAGLGMFVNANDHCAAQGGNCDAQRVCEVARMTLLAAGPKEASLGALLAAAMLNPCVGRSIAETGEIGPR